MRNREGVQYNGFYAQVINEFAQFLIKRKYVKVEKNAHGEYVEIGDLQKGLIEGMICYIREDVTFQYGWLRFRLKDLFEAGKERRKINLLRAATRIYSPIKPLKPADVHVDADVNDIYNAYYWAFKGMNACKRSLEWLVNSPRSLYRHLKEQNLVPAN